MFEKKVRGMINRPCDMDKAIDKIVPWLYNIADKVKNVIGVIVVCIIGIYVFNYFMEIQMEYYVALLTLILVDIGILAIYHIIAKFIIAWLVSHYFRDKFMDICEDIIYENGWYTGAVKDHITPEESNPIDSTVEYFNEIEDDDDD